MCCRQRKVRKRRREGNEGQRLGHSSDRDETHRRATRLPFRQRVGEGQGQGANISMHFESKARVNRLKRVVHRAWMQSKGRRPFCASSLPYDSYPLSETFSSVEFDGTLGTLRQAPCLNISVRQGPPEGKGKGGKASCNESAANRAITLEDL